MQKLIIHNLVFYTINKGLGNQNPNTVYNKEIKSERNLFTLAMKDSKINRKQSARKKAGKKIKMRSNKKLGENKNESNSLKSKLRITIKG